MLRRAVKAITNNWHLKLMSIGLAAMSWFLVTGAGIQEVEIGGVPVEIVTPDGISVWEVSRSRLKVRLKGPRVELSTVGSRDIQARYEVAADTVVEGHKIIDVKCQGEMLFTVPVGVRATEVDPPRIKIDLVPKIASRVEVEARLVGDVEPGFEMADVRVVPARVSVAGPEPIVRGLKSLRTRPVNRDGRIESFRERVSVENKVRGYELEIAESVEVRVGISEQLATQLLKDQSIMVMRPSAWVRDVAVVPDRVDVTVKGQKHVLARLTPEHVVLFVRVDKEGKHRLPVEAKVHMSGVSVVGDLPEVEVTVRR